MQRQRKVHNQLESHDTIPLTAKRKYKIPTLPFTNLIFIRICKYFWLQKTQTWVSSSIENIPPKRISQKQKHLGKDVVGTI